jgi:hypothetical protein
MNKGGTTMANYSFDIWYTKLSEQLKFKQDKDEFDTQNKWCILVSDGTIARLIFSPKLALSSVEDSNNGFKLPEFQSKTYTKDTADEMSHLAKFLNDHDILHHVANNDHQHTALKVFQLLYAFMDENFITKSLEDKPHGNAYRS